MHADSRRSWSGRTVFAGCRDGNLYALNVADGSELWTFAADAPIGLGLSAAGNLAYVIDDFGTLYAVDISTGEEAWRFGTPVSTHPAIEDGLLVTGTDNGVLVGIDAETGSELWRSEVHDGRPLNTPAMADGLVYAASQAGGMVAVDAESGELRWQTDTAEGSAGTSVVADGIVFSTVILPDTTARQFALDALTGEILWQRDGDFQNPDVSNGIGYSHGLGGLVQAFNTQDGSELWRVQVGGPTRAGAVAGDVHYAPSDADRTIYALDTATGEKFWRFEVDGSIEGSIAVADGRLFVTTMAGSVYAIGGSDESLIAAPAADASPVAAEPVAPVELLWQTSGGPEPLLASFDSAIGPDGNLWVIDACNNRFQIFDPAGTFVRTWGGPGTGPGQFSFVKVPPVAHSISTLTAISTSSTRTTSGYRNSTRMEPSSANGERLEAKTVSFSIPAPLPLTTRDASSFATWAGTTARSSIPMGNSSSALADVRATRTLSWLDPAIWTAMRTGTSTCQMSCKIRCSSSALMARCWSVGVNRAVDPDSSPARMTSPSMTRGMCTSPRKGIAGCKCSTPKGTTWLNGTARAQPPGASARRV